MFGQGPKGRVLRDAYAHERGSRGRSDNGKRCGDLDVLPRFKSSDMHCFLGIMCCWTLAARPEQIKVNTRSGGVSANFLP